MDAICTDKSLAAHRATMAIGFLNGDRHPLWRRNGIPIPDSELDVDVGEAAGGLIKRLCQIRAVHDGVWRAEALSHCRTQFQCHKRCGAPEGVDINANRLDTVGGDGLIEAQAIKDQPGVRADLQPRAEFGYRTGPFEHNYFGAKFGERKSYGQPGNAGAGHEIDLAGTRHAAKP